MRSWPFNLVATVTDGDGNVREIEVAAVTYQDNYSRAGAGVYEADGTFHGLVDIVEITLNLRGPDFDESDRPPF